MGKGLFTKCLHSCSKCLLLFVVAFIIGGCSQLDDYVPNAGTPPSTKELTAQEKDVMSKMFKPNKSISLENALQGLHATEISTQSATRSVAHFDSVQYLTKNILYGYHLPDSIYSYLPDTLAYLVGNGEGNGFSVLSADVRIGQSVLIQTDNGDVPDLTTLTPEYSYILDNVAEYVLGRLVEYRHLEDSLGESIRQKLDAALEEDLVANGTRIKEAPVVLSWEYMSTLSSNDVTTKRIDPLIPTQWGQELPYNAKASEMMGKEVKAGCVATSTAQLMAYWKYPSIVGGMEIHWDVLRTVNKYHPLLIREAPHVMWTIGENIDMEYGIEESGAKTIDAVAWLNSIGYEGGEERDYSFNLVEQSLENGCPVLITGCRTKTSHHFLGIKMGTTYSGGHSWLIDGILKRYRVLQDVYKAKMSDGTTVVKGIIRYEYNNYQHCNWGWYGSCDGWFLEGNFYANDKMADILNRGTEYDASWDTSVEDRTGFFDNFNDSNPTPTRASDTSSEDRNYQYLNKIFINLKPAI